MARIVAESSTINTFKGLAATTFLTAPAGVASRPGHLNAAVKDVHADVARVVSADRFALQHDAVLPQQRARGEDVALPHRRLSGAEAGDVGAADDPHLAALLLHAVGVRRLKQQRNAGVGKRRRLHAGALRVDARIRQQHVNQSRDPHVRIPQAHRDATAKRVRQDHRLAIVRDRKLADADDDALARPSDARRRRERAAHFGDGPCATMAAGIDETAAPAITRLPSDRPPALSSASDASRRSGFRRAR